MCCFFFGSKSLKITNVGMLWEEGRMPRHARENLDEWQRWKDTHAFFVPEKLNILVNNSIIYFSSRESNRGCLYKSYKWWEYLRALFKNRLRPSKNSNCREKLKFTSDESNLLVNTLQANHILLPYGYNLSGRKCKPVSSTVGFLFLVLFILTQFKVTGWAAVC